MKTCVCRSRTDNFVVQVHWSDATCVDWSVPQPVVVCGHCHPSIHHQNSRHEQRLPFAEEHPHGLCFQGDSALQYCSHCTCHTKLHAEFSSVCVHHVPVDCNTVSPWHPLLLAVCASLMACISMGNEQHHRHRSCGGEKYCCMLLASVRVSCS